MTNILDLALNLFNYSCSSKNEFFVVDSKIGSFLSIVKKYNESEENIIVYCPNSFDANNLFSYLAAYLDKEKIILLPNDDLIRTEYISESKEIKCEQIYCLYKARHSKHNIIIVTPNSLYRYYPSVELFDNSFINLKVGDEVDFEKLKAKLLKLGYIKVNKIDQSLEYASRGGVIDVYSLNYPDPIRIEFFDTLIESIRMFKIDTQTSYQNLDDVTIIPASINLLTDEELLSAESKIENQFKKDSTNLNEEDKELLKDNLRLDIDEIKTGIISSKNYKYIGFLQGFYTTFLDYLSNYSIIISNFDDFNKSRDLSFDEGRKFLLELQENKKCISHLSYFNESIDIYKKANKVITLNPFFIHKEDTSIPLKSIDYLNPKNMNAKLMIESLITQNYKIVLALNDESQIKTIEEILKDINKDYIITNEFNADDNKITIVKNNFPISFELLNDSVALLSYTDLFLGKNKIKTYSTKFKQGKILGSYEELEPGDYVVHEKYGIGRFEKIDTIEVGGKHNDYIEVSYANNDKLYVPLYQFNLIRKYTGKEGATPRLTNLNSNQWEKTKKKIKDKVDDLADRLLSLYQERAKIPGYAFKPDDEIQEMFEKKFSHSLTADQVESIKEIKEDMEKPHPMDRLLCGDVGFGKTEVAFEAAMKAILSGKQVCLLSPTTVLAMQHYKVAVNRFKDFGVKIAFLSRMNTAKEVTEIKKLLKEGKIDLLIGTHKVLGKEINFKDLGLLIIDEEQRFGVEQKEKIKEKYHNIDVLTLSATPIPRTLQSSLVGLKNISKIETPPSERMPIQTYVIDYDEAVIKELIKRELARNGQVYYVYNEVASIYEKQLKLQNLVPEARIGVIHGEMDKEDIDQVMHEFYEGEINILLATTIIENGIDVRNANLLLIENADRFGLAQLYQIKGRVGRGDKMAFAYLMINGRKTITEDSKKRLKAIQDFTELGSGYKIAQRDLLIRGAGDILGKEQAGFIDEVGIDMYIRLLNESIDEKKGIRKKETFKEVKALNDLDVYIPKKLAKNDEKIEIYQKILDCKNVYSLDSLMAELKDQYGKIPESVISLFTKRTVVLYLQQEEFEKYNEYPKRVEIILSEKFCEIKGIGSTLFTSLIMYVNKIKIMYRDRLIYISIDKNDGWIDLLIEILKIVDKIYNSKKKVMIKDEN